jgi:hypothetical protein
MGIVKQTFFKYFWIDIKQSERQGKIFAYDLRPTDIYFISQRKRRCVANIFFFLSQVHTAYPAFGVTAAAT